MNRCSSTGIVNTVCSSNNDPFVEIVTKKARKQRQATKKNQISASQPNASIDDSSSSHNDNMDIIISLVASSMNSYESGCSKSNSPNLSQDNKCTCDELKLELTSARAAILQLQNKVDFLMSYLDLIDDVSSNNKSSTTSLPQEQSIQVQSANGVAMVPSNGLQSKVPSYANAT